MVQLFLASMCYREAAHRPKKKKKLKKQTADFISLRTVREALPLCSFAREKENEML